MENMQQVCSKVRNATYKLSLYDAAAKNDILMAVADKIEQNKENVKKINAIDIQNAKGKLSEAMIISYVACLSTLSTNPTISLSSPRFPIAS